MLPRERVIQVIRHQKPDRIPLYGWVRANLEEPIKERFGSVEAFEDHYEFDFAHVFGGPHQLGCLPKEKQALFHKGELTPRDFLDVPLPDPDDADAYQKVRDLVRHHKEERGRFVYVQTPGFFEGHNGVWGIQNHLCHLIEYPDELREVYARQAEWTKKYAANCLEIGCDMIHVSDDWGAQVGLMFSPRTWRELIFPFHKEVVDFVKSQGAFASLHTDGNNNDVIDGIIEIGYDVVHPWQESAGMSLSDFRDNYRDRLTVMGGLDVQTTVGFGKLDHLRGEIERVCRMFADGGLLFCTTHFIQAHCTIDELVVAFDTAREMTRKFS
jgi:uroporphyrinogen decarboxylase